MNRNGIKVTIQIICWIAAMICLVFVVSFLTKRSNSVMIKKTNADYIGICEPDITDGKMTPVVLLSLGRLSDPQISPDGQYILYGVSYTSVKENKSCRNLYVCRTDGSDRQQITASDKSISNARWCAGGKKIAFICEGQIKTASIKMTNGKWRLSRTVKISEIPEGISGFSISPDGNKLMYISTVKSNLDMPSRQYGDLDKANAYATDDLMYRHWDHWVETLPHTFVTDADLCNPKANSIKKENSTDILSAESELYELPMEPFGGMEQLNWSPDGQFIAYSCKKLTGKKYAFSTDSEIYIYRISDGKTWKVTDGGGYDSEPVWSPDGGKLCWISMERDGYEADKQRLMVVDISIAEGEIILGKTKELSEGFKYNVAGPVWSGSSIYFNALADGLQGIFKVGAEDGKICRITGDDLWYDFSSPFHIISDENGETLLTSWCSMDFPTELVAVKVGAEGVETAPVTTENAHILDRLSLPKTEKRYIKTVDGKDMLTWVMYPPEFDESQVYPSILICLGGPQGTLSQGWSYRWNYRLMASQGYVVVMPNRRGTTAFGQDWTEQISGDYIGLNIQDYLSAAKAIKAEKYIGKMAACGASYGGYSVFYLCGVHGDVFDAFIGHAGIFNEEHMYLTTEEMWFPNWDNGGLHEYQADTRVGTADCPIGPAGDGETFGGIRQGGSPWSTAPKSVRHYENSPHTLVKNWHTPLLVIHGGMDFRVPYDQGMAAYNSAQLMGVPSRLVVFPDENHWILKPQNALYWHREYFAWLDKWCK